MNDASNLMDHTASVAAAYFANTQIAPDKVAEVIGSIHSALSGCGIEKAPEFTPAVDPDKSIKPDYLVSLITGGKFKMLRRHLATNGLTPEQYRERYGLPNSYPMVAANYAARRRVLAKQIGLGTKANRAGATAH